jgi:hypothetical protein
MYLIVKESGEYSEFKYEIIKYYHTREQAEYAIELLEYETSLHNKAATINCTWVERCDYIIEKVPEGESIKNEEEFCNEKQKIFDKYKDKIEQETVNRINKIKDIETKNLIKKARKQQVLEFWEWWNNNKEVDPYYDKKKQAKIHEILPIMCLYLAEDFHSNELTEWYIKNKGPFS